MSIHGFDADKENGLRLRGASPPMRMTASWFGSRRIHRIQGCGAMIAATWQARLDRLSSVVTKLTAKRILGMAHYGLAHAFAINPARLKARPCGLRGLTAQRGQARALSCQESDGVVSARGVHPTNGGLAKWIEGSVWRNSHLTRRAPYKDGTILLGGVLQPFAVSGHTSALDSVMFLSSSFSEFNHAFRAAPSGTTPVSR